MERRAFLAGAVALAAAPILPVPADGGTQAAALRVTTSAYRRLDAATPARDLIAPARTHLRLIEAISVTAPADQHRHLAAAASEAASFAAWLAWDMADHGSARAAYGQAITSARTAANPLLLAYQIGSLAQMEAHLGNGATCLSLVHRARTVLTDRPPAVADAWLCATEALGHAAAGDPETCDQALIHSAALAAGTTGEAPPAAPPWPWVFPFDEAKVNATRATCGAWLGRPTWTLSHAPAVPVTAHTKQQALALLDLAAAHLSVGRYDTGVDLATRGLDTGLQLGSGRIVERARALRRTIPGTSTATVVRALDDRLHTAYL
ncbi:hypothetical protein BU198_06645 [Streptomyces sp. CBMA156]|nr:hypothetical protein [Streptomyces sp. CBMA156]